MALLFLDEIVSTEKQAEQLELDAQSKARDIIASAKRKTTTDIENTIISAEATGNQRIKSLEENAIKDIADIKSSILSECDKIEQSAAQKLPKAVDFIVGKVVNRSVNR